MRLIVIVLALAGNFLIAPTAFAKGYGTSPMPTPGSSVSNKPKLTIYGGSGITSQYFQKAVLADARVKDLQQEFEVRHGGADEALRKGIKSLPAMLVSRGGATYIYEGNFRHVEDFIAFLVSAKAGKPLPRL